MSASTKPLSTKPARFMSKLELRGTQLAGWTPTTTSPPLAGGILFDENVEIALPDGTVLKGDLFRPAGAGRVPVLISWAVYIKDTERMGAIFIDESGICDYVIKQGYAELRVQPRGTGASGGVAGDEMFGPQEVQDCHDVIEWAAGQDWCSGDVGMIGMSAFAVAQLVVAATKPPHLRPSFLIRALPISIATASIRAAHPIPARWSYSRWPRRWCRQKFRPGRGIWRAIF